MIHRWWQLAIRNWRLRFTRTLTESIAVVIACALVVAMTAAFASAERALWHWHERWVGKVSAHITSRESRPFEQSEINVVAGIEGVHLAAGRLHDRVQLIGPGGQASVILIGRQLPNDLQLRSQELLAGRQLGEDADDEIVIEAASANLLNVGIGDRVQARIYDDSWDLTVVGIVSRPPLFSFIPQTVYVSLPTAQRMLDRPRMVDSVYVQFEDAADADQVARRIGQRLGDRFELHRSADNKALLQENLPLWRASLYAMCGLLVVVAMFLIFATLSCEVIRRVGEMGALRCAGASRGQLVGLVMMESLPIAIWGIVLGAPLGLGGSWLLVRCWPGLFAQGWAVSGWGLLAGAGGAMAATMAGTLLPALAASRMTPVQAYSISGRSTRRWPIATAVAAAILLAVPMVQLQLTNDPLTAVRMHVFIGLPLLACGLFLACPPVLAALAGPIARGLGLLLRVHQQLVGRWILGARWRSTAVVTALALCVSLVVAANTETESLLASFKLPTQFPDLLVILPSGVTSSQASQAFQDLGVQKWVGLNGFDIKILDLPQRQQGTLMQTMTYWRKGNTWFLSLDEDQLADLAKLDFTAGTAEQAVRKLAQGDAIIVSESFVRRLAVGLGDKVSVLDYRGKPFQLEIAGIVGGASLEVAGVAYEFSELYRQNAARAVLGSSATAARRFDQHGYSILLVDTTSSAESDEIAGRLRTRWRSVPMEHLSLRRLKEQIESDFRRLTLIFSLVGGLFAAAVATAGVANAMVAAVHSRRRELGILHAVGMTRGQLVRLVLGEALVLGLIASAMGVAVGLYASRMAARIHELLLGRAMVFSVPFGAVAVVIALAVAATVGSAIAAAGRAGRANVMDLMAE
ncbi:MAG: FtsX-like permease family protein [Planctomycetes bacterium]|nr:FtsX-like permease family protein [Planctomycetota bacterium]